MDIGAGIGIAGNAAAYGIDNAKDKGALAAGQLDGGKGISRFATLRDGKDDIIGTDDGIAVTELGGVLYLHRYLAEGLEELLANEASVPTGATGNDDEAAGTQEAVAIEIDGREVDAIALILVGNLNVIFSFCREINGEKKFFCLVTNPRKKLKYRMFTEAES
jgi:hypothetical protein